MQSERTNVIPGFTSGNADKNGKAIFLYAGDSRILWARRIPPPRGQKPEAMQCCSLGSGPCCQGRFWFLPKTACCDVGRQGLDPGTPFPRSPLLAAPQSYAPFFLAVRSWPREALAAQSCNICMEVGMVKVSWAG